MKRHCGFEADGAATAALPSGAKNTFPEAVPTAETAETGDPFTFGPTRTSARSWISRPAPLFKAENGVRGGSSNCYGKRGKDLIVDVPTGTIVRDEDTQMVIRDLTEPYDQVCVARGGKGGRGNKHFATATHRTPREFEYGEDGEERRLALELKLIADVGLVGLPNAGKSTFLSRVSSAHPKIADYPFTTLQPHLGIVENSDMRRIVVADLPGLIEGAHNGQGLGDEFLKHIERTRVICHVVDMAPLSGPDPLSAYRMIRNELALYSAELAAKRHLIAANKLDLTDAADHLAEFEKEVDAPVYSISAVTGKGLPALINALIREIDACS